MERDEIVLIGPVCVGKTTVGRIVAARPDVPFTDVDDLADASRLTCTEFDPAAGPAG